MKYVNLGCGNRFHKDWENYDFKSQSSLVKEINLNKTLPFKNESVDVIYSSHVLEHFTRCKAPLFLKECYRVLKPNGIIRIVVPDLEQIIRNYLLFLEKAKKGDIDAQEKYEWTMIELFDQMVRNYSGGEMFNYWKQDPMPQEKFILQRLGSEVDNALKHLRKNNIKPRTNCVDKNALEIGEFRLSGEIHQWMYDEYSLKRILKDTSFLNINKVTAHESKIKNFNSFLLDIEKNGKIRKPDSLFMEAIK